MIHTLLPAKKASARKVEEKSNMPLPVAKWLLENTRMSARDFRRIKTLNTKVKSETITQEETAELDAILDACLKVDILRAQATAAMMKKAAKTR